MRARKFALFESEDILPGVLFYLEDVDRVRLELDIIYWIEGRHLYDRKFN